MEFIT